MTIHLGYAQVDITPDLSRPVYLAGFGRNRRARSVHDPLWARALALEDGQTRAVVVAVDLLGLSRVHCLAVGQRVQAAQPGARVLIGCTHTHHGPDTIGLWGPDAIHSGVDPAYMTRLEDALVQVCQDALAATQPGQLRATSTLVTGVAKNARDPEIRDEELTCLQFTDSAGKSVRATWVVFPCHPEVLWDENPAITGDYCHFLRRHVEAETGAPCMVHVGALGGMMTPDMPGHTFADAEVMGVTLGEAALEALAATPVRPVQTLHHRRRTFTTSLTNPLFRMAMEAGILPNLLEANGLLSTEANLIAMDHVWLCGVPGELLPKLGLAYKAQMRRAGAQVASILGLLNDELGYILPPEDFHYPEDPFAPGEHYEETMSVGPEIGPNLSQAVGVLLAEQGGGAR